MIRPRFQSASTIPSLVNKHDRDYYQAFITRTVVNQRAAARKGPVDSPILLLKRNQLEENYLASSNIPPESPIPPLPPSPPPPCFDIVAPDSAARAPREKRVVQQIEMPPIVKEKIYWKTHRLNIPNSPSAYDSSDRPSSDALSSPPAINDTLARFQKLLNVQSYEAAIRLLAASIRDAGIIQIPAVLSILDPQSAKRIICACGASDDIEILSTLLQLYKEILNEMAASSSGKICDSALKSTLSCWSHLHMDAYFLEHVLQIAGKCADSEAIHDIIKIIENPNDEAIIDKRKKVIGVTRFTPTRECVRLILHFTGDTEYFFMYKRFKLLPRVRDYSTLFDVHARLGSNPKSLFFQHMTGCKAACVLEAGQVGISDDDTDKISDPVLVVAIARAFIKAKRVSGLWRRMIHFHITPAVLWDIYNMLYQEGAYQHYMAFYLSMNGMHTELIDAPADSASIIQSNMTASILSGCSARDTEMKELELAMRCAVRCTPNMRALFFTFLASCSPKILFRASSILARVPLSEKDDGEDKPMDVQSS